MNYSADFKDLVTALCKAQAVLTGAVKDSQNPHLRSWYADLHSCWEALRGPLTANGLAVLQPFATADGRVTVTTILAHSSGQWMSMEASLMPKSGAPAELGIAVAYLRRYSLAAMTGLSQMDMEDAGTSEDRQPEPGPPAKFVSRSIASPEGLNQGALSAKQNGYVASLFKDACAIIHDADAPDTLRATALLELRGEMNEDAAVFAAVWKKLGEHEKKTFKALLALAEKAA